MNTQGVQISELCRSSSLKFATGLALFVQLLSSTSAFAADGQSQCKSAKPSVAVDVGHSATRFGATSARGAREYEFNRRFAEELVARAKSSGEIEAFLISPQQSEIGLRRRAELANDSGADAFVSIHHDSAQRKLLTSWIVGGRNFLKSDKIRGFSLFVSRENPQFEKSKAVAAAIARRWLRAGHRRTLHHAAKIKGENRELLNATLGIYEAPFAVIRRTVIPAVLVEVGVLINPAEEDRLSASGFRRRLQDGLIAALRQSVCVTARSQ